MSGLAALLLLPVIALALTVLGHSRRLAANEPAST